MSKFSSEISSFKQAVLKGLEVDANLAVGKTLGENGHACYTKEGLGDSLLALFDRLFQGIDEVSLRDGLREIIRNGRGLDDPELLMNVFVLPFSARWCRGGKGAKLAFYQCLKMLYEDFPGVVIKVLPLIPTFGYWKDYFLLLQEIQDFPVEGVDYSPVSDAVYRIYAAQLMRDYAIVTECRAAGTKPSISFAGKYAPRERKQFSKSLHAVRELALLMFPPFQSDIVVIGDEEKRSEQPAKPDKKRYREVVSALSAALDVPEVKMCSHHFADINMSGVPSRCLKRNVKAFSNEALDQDLSPAEEATGNRFPDDADRVQARRNIIDALVNKGVKGAQVYPHELVAKAREHLSVVDKLTLVGQWKSMRESMVKMVEDRAEAVVDGPSRVAGGLGKLIPMCDVSGSMSGTPMDVSIGLGVLCSEMNHPAFKDLVLCFSGDASWHNLGGCADIVQKVHSLAGATWHMNTNFYAAMERIVKVVRDNRLTQEDVPNILVISDMQFDAAATNASTWNSVYDNIEDMFRKVGVEVHGAPLTPPTIVFWNVRHATGFPVKSDQKGVVMLSGFSPALLKFVLSGELEREDEVVEIDETTKEVVTKSVKRLVTPVETMYEALHESAYEPLRDILRTCVGELRAGVLGENPLSRYTRRTAKARGGEDVEEAYIVGVAKMYVVKEDGGKGVQSGRGGAKRRRRR